MTYGAIALQGASFQNANLYGAKMQGVEAQMADFRGTDLRQANLGGAYLEGAMMPAVTAEKTAFKEALAAEGKPDRGKTVERDRERGGRGR